MDGCVTDASEAADDATCRPATGELFSATASNDVGLNAITTIGVRRRTERVQTAGNGTFVSCWVSSHIRDASSGLRSRE